MVPILDGSFFWSKNVNEYQTNIRNGTGDAFSIDGSCIKCRRYRIMQIVMSVVGLATIAIVIKTMKADPRL
jgi:hypothetical protein